MIYYSDLKPRPGVVTDEDEYWIGFTKNVCDNDSFVKEVWR